MDRKAIEHLIWIYQRMVKVHGENPNYDYMLRLKEIIESIPYMGTLKVTVDGL